MNVFLDVEMFCSADHVPDDQLHHARQTKQKPVIAAVAKCESFTSL
jgi:hypothetical protein